MRVGDARWAESRTYSFALLICAGSFYLDGWKDGSTFGMIAPAAFALIVGRIYRQVKRAEAELEDES